MEPIKVSETHISNLNTDPRNPRKRTVVSSSIIEKSLEQFGACRSIVIDENGTVRAGNGTLTEAEKLGIEKIIIVEATGSELVAVKRSGLSEEQWKQYTIADNTASDFSFWDREVLSEISDIVDLSDFFPEDKLNEIIGRFEENQEVDSSGDEGIKENTGHTKEINPDEFEFSHQCPKCGFQFNEQ